MTKTKDRKYMRSSTDFLREFAGLGLRAQVHCLRLQERERETETETENELLFFLCHNKGNENR
jgi:hypothetical protein